MGRDVLHHYAGEFSGGRHVACGDAADLLDALISESDETLLDNVLRAWDAKGIVEDELVDLAVVMRSRMRRVDTLPVTTIDIVGTGGSRAKTFNVSTAAAFVVAGHGIAVAKHNNRAATSRSGSADVLTELGVRIDIGPEAAEQCLHRTGLCFMFAPDFHSLSPTLAGVRRSLGFPTIFNCLGPLCNPASVPYQVIGVWSPEVQQIVAGVVERLGTARTWVVHGSDGLDEVTLNGPTSVANIGGRMISETYDIELDEFGPLNVSGEVPVPGTPAESAALIRAILNGEREGTPEETLVLINAATAIHVSGFTGSLYGGIRRARESIYSGDAARKLKEMIAVTNE